MAISKVHHHVDVHQSKGLRPANERRRYFVTTSLIGWVQAQNHPCIPFLCDDDDDDDDDEEDDGDDDDDDEEEGEEDEDSGGGGDDDDDICAFVQNSDKRSIVNNSFCHVRARIHSSREKLCK